jgi:hypothetical protein
MTDDVALSILLSEIEAGVMPPYIGVKRAGCPLGFSVYTRWCDGPRNADYVLHLLADGLRILDGNGRIRFSPHLHTLP